MGFIKSTLRFFTELTVYNRIPQRDRRVIFALLILIASPVDLIPDWIPVFGLLDDLVYLAIICDYLFNVLDKDIILSHYPWGMKSYAVLRRSAILISYFSPSFLMNWIWKFQPSPYRH